MSEREWDRDWSIDDFSIFFDPEMPDSKHPFVEWLAIMAEKSPEPISDTEEEHIRELLRDAGYASIGQNGSTNYAKRWGHVTTYIWKYLGTGKGWPVEWGEDGPWMTPANAANFKAAAGRASEGYISRHRAVRPTAARRTAGGGVKRGAVTSEYDEPPAACPDCFHTLPLNGICGNCE